MLIKKHVPARAGVGVNGTVALRKKKKDEGVTPVRQRSVFL